MEKICAVTEDNSHEQYKCQFGNQNLYAYKDNEYCQYHLPLSSPIKAELPYKKDLEELINKGEDFFLYVNLSNLVLCLSSLKLKKSLSFRLSNIDGLKITSYEDDLFYINFFECRIKNEIIFKDLSIRKIRFDNCEISHCISNSHINNLQYAYNHAVFFEHVKLNELIFEDHTKVKNNIFILSECEINYLTISEKTILGNAQDFNFNIFTKFLVGAKVNTVTLTDSSLYMAFELQDINIINNLVFDKFLCFQAPCIRGTKEFSGNLILPNISECFTDDLSCGIDKKIDENYKLTYWEKNFDNYKRLNKLAISNNLFNAESDYFVLSKRCMEKYRRPIDLISNSFSRIYDFSSSYGTNPSEVFFWYCFILFIPSAIYQFDEIKMPIFEGLNSMTRFFNFQLLMKENISLISKIVSISQTISGVFLSAIFVISLKWYFRKR